MRYQQSRIRRANKKARAEGKTHLAPKLPPKPKRPIFKFGEKR